ncbi:MAG: exosome complex exonuclease Rrp41 [Candidatus Micrarchaeia archaeon]
MEEVKLIVDGKRLDGRRFDELRPIKIVAGVLKKADGSAYVEWGNNKILAGVYGPKECIPRHETNPYRAIMRCRYIMAPFSTASEHGKAGPNRRSIELSKVIRHVFENVVFLEKFPRTEINLYLEVLQADGGTRCAAITAGAVALANAGIPMRDLVCAVAVGKIDGTLCLDLTGAEDNHGESDMPIAVAHNTKEVLLFQMDGLLTKEEIEKAMGMALDACEKIHKLQVDALKAVFETPVLDE